MISKPLVSTVGFDAAVRLDHADDDVDAFEPALTALAQHLIGLADARRGTEKHLEPPARLPARLLQQRFG